eukprot:8565154-Ditylum_brightwellii.AAC.1
MINRGSFTIASLPFSEKKKTNKSRRRNGYNVYVLLYIVDFKVLNEEEKENHLFASGVWATPVLSLSDKDNTRTPPRYMACHIMMAAARHWHTLDEDYKCAWEKEAVKLTMMPVSGKFCSFPKEISKIPRIYENRMLEE